MVRDLELSDIIFRLTQQQLAKIIKVSIQRYQHKRSSDDLHLICDMLKMKNQSPNNPYKNGIKRCTKCDAYFDCDDAFCLCCGTRLKKKSAMEKSIPIL